MNRELDNEENSKNIKAIMYEYDMTFKQALVFYFLLKNLGKIVSKNEICEYAKISEKGRSLAVHITNIRWKVFSKYSVDACYGEGYSMVRQCN